MASDEPEIDLSTVRDVNELACMSKERLTRELQRRGLKTGGSLMMKAERLWWKCKMVEFADSSRSKIQDMRNRRPAGAYGTVQPINLAAERDRFLIEADEYESGRTTTLPRDPVFEYADMDSCEAACPAVPCTCARGKLWHEYGEPTHDFMPHALEVLHRARESGVAALTSPAGTAAVAAGADGEDMTEAEAEEEVGKYLEMHGIAHAVVLEWLDKDKCSVPSMRTRCDPAAGANAVTGRLHMIRGVPMRRQKLRSLLDHEVGTHFLRAYNQNVRAGLPALRLDATSHVRTVTPLEDLETEEGLATINTHISSTCKILWSPALSYYVQSRSRDLSFTQLFLDLRQYVLSPMSRWAFCMRSKRGLRDTSLCGGLAKDRVYFEGALKILMQRHEIDFGVLHSGKVTLQEHARVRKHLRSLEMIFAANTRAKFKLPHFIQDMRTYMRALDDIAFVNGIEGEDTAHRKLLRAPSVRPGRALFQDGNLTPISRSATVVGTHDSNGNKIEEDEERRAEWVQGRVAATPTRMYVENKRRMRIGEHAWIDATGDDVQRQAARIMQTATRNKSLRRSLTEQRLHECYNKRQEKTDSILSRCFSVKSRWGGIAFQWD